MGIFKRLDDDRREPDKANPQASADDSTGCSAEAEDQVESDEPAVER